MSPTQTQTAHGWLTQQEIDEVRGRVPIVYVEGVPVRIDHLSHVQRVGLLLRTRADGTISRAVISGRVLWGETVREALWRHLAKDLGPDAEPLLPTEPTPFTVAEYFPEDRRGTGFADPRQHAVALAYVVPVEGECEPARDTLDLAWLTPKEAVSPAVADEMAGGHDKLVRLALAHAGVLP